MPPPQMYTDGYNYPQSYAPPTQAYGTYDYSMQAQPPFNAYPSQTVMQPVPPGLLKLNNAKVKFLLKCKLGDDFQQSGWVHPTHMAIPPPALVIPPPLQQAPIESEEEKLKREGMFLDR